MMPPTDRIHEHNEQDPGRVAHTRQEAGSNDFLAVGPALRILQLNVEGFSAAKRSIVRDMAERIYSTKRMMTQSYGWNLQRLQHSRNINIRCILASVRELNLQG